MQATYTIEECLPKIIYLAEHFTGLKASHRRMLESLVPRGESLNYYLGAFVTIYNMCVIEYSRTADITPLMQNYLLILSVRYFELHRA